MADCLMRQGVEQVLELRVFYLDEVAKRGRPQAVRAQALLATKRPLGMFYVVFIHGYRRRLIDGVFEYRDIFASSGGKTR